MTSNSWTAVRAAFLASATALAAPAAWAAETAGTAATQDQGALRVCASTVEAPYSMKDAKGFENKIAIAVAEAMGRKAEFVWFDKAAIYLVRDGLDKKLCDVVLGVDTGDERVLSTKPYFRTGYVYVTRPDEGDMGTNWQAIEKPQFTKFAVRFQTPAELMIKQAGKYEDTVSYQLSLVNFQDKRNKYTQVAADKLVSEVASGEADIAIAFASDVARYVKESSKPLNVTMIDDDFTLSDGTKVPLHYDQAMGVRKDDKELAAALDAAIRKAQPQIDQVLRDEGVPLLKQSS
ncbi:methanol oxidation system protein MoxJ [Hansschlegelia beijingensis]